MPGVEVHAEAVEALLAGSAVRMPPAWFKYVFAALLLMFTCFVFWRGEPSWDMDAIFVACNLLLVIAAFIGLSSFSVRSEEHTSELQSLMRISYAVFCLKKKHYD